MSKVSDTQLCIQNIHIAQKAIYRSLNMNGGTNMSLIPPSFGEDERQTLGNIRYFVPHINFLSEWSPSPSSLKLAFMVFCPIFNL